MARQPGDNQPSRELELRFEVDSASAERLRNVSWLKPMQAGRASTRTLSATYFDTPDKDLGEGGLSLRIGREGRAYKQTLKAPDGRVFARRAWESLLAKPVPDPAELLDNPDFHRHVAKPKRSRLEPVFETRVKRTTRRLVPGEGTEIDYGLEVGEIAAGADGDAVTRPITRLELELKAGDPRRLFDIARKIAETAPVRLDQRTTAECGYALLRGGGPPWSKQAPVELASDATGEDVLVESVTRCIEHLDDNVECILARADDEGVHQARVALRRLRSALHITRDMLPADERKRLNKQLKEMQRLFGDARDWDVFIAEILGPVEETHPGDKALTALRAAAAARQDAAYDRVAETLCSPAYSRMLIDLGEFLYARPWRDGAAEAKARLDGPARTLAAEVLGKAHKNLLKEGRGLAEMNKEARHQLRINGKKLRYAAEFFAPLYRKQAVGQYLEPLKSLQDDLGALMDFEVARHLVSELAAAAAGDAARQLDYAGGVVVGWHAHLAAEREKKILAHWKRVAKSTPFWD